MSKIDEAKALARKRAEQAAAQQSELMPQAEPKKEPAHKPDPKPQQVEFPEVERKELRRKREKFLDKYSSQTFYIRNDLWERAQNLMTERGDRTLIINEALEEYLKRKET